MKHQYKQPSSAVGTTQKTHYLPQEVGVVAGTLWKRSYRVGPKILLLSSSLYFSFSLKSKMIQLAKPGPFFKIKDILYITM
jgi:hypothetical protein